MAEPVLSLLGGRVRVAVAEAFGPDAAVPEPPVLPARDPRHGDYSLNAPLVLAKALRERPPVLAERLVAALDVDDVCEPPEVAGGFVNLRLRPAFLAERLAAQLGDDRAGIDPAQPRHRVVVDYSGPNVAKPMHVGHLRSTVIGDCLANVHAFLGHEVERVNHLGDWGTQFGLLIAQLEDVAPDAVSGGAQIGDLVALYREANERQKVDPAFHERARARVVDLQSGEPTARAAWAAMVEVTRHQNEGIYELLGIHGLEERGESFYEPLLPGVVADLESAGLVVEDGGAEVVYVEGFTNRDGEPLPLIVRKTDGAYNYATTDLAAIRHRLGVVGADRVLYVVAADQAQHFAMVFAVARRAGWVGEGVELTHVGFGLVLGEGGTRIKTREGDAVGLGELLEEGVQRARAFLVDRAAERGEEPPADADHVARVIGVGAVKYADLSQNRQSNYVFSFDKSLTLRGNTAPYLQYAYARIRSILREAGWDGAPPGGVGLVLEAPEERVLATRIVEMGDVLERVVADAGPNHLCAWLYELSAAYNGFYEACPVLRAEEPTRTSRLALCSATSTSLRLGLSLLGINVLERV